MEETWSGLSLQKPGDQLLDDQAHGRYSALGGKQIQRKSLPSEMYMPMYEVVAADHLNGILRQARNARWVVCFGQFLCTVR